MSRAAFLKSFPAGDKKVTLPQQIHIKLINLKPYNRKSFKTLMATAEEYISQANQIDYDDCGKKVLCLLASKKKGKKVFLFLTN
jgi:hypothetical protein